MHLRRLVEVPQEDRVTLCLAPRLACARHVVAAHHWKAETLLVTMVAVTE